MCTKKSCMTDLQAGMEKNNIRVRPNMANVYFWLLNTADLPRLRILNLLLLILLGSESLVGQNSTCSFQNPVSVTFGYNRENPELSVIPNEMISVIAEDAIRSPRRIFFTLNTEMQIRIEPQKGRNPAARITFGSNSLNGDIRFRKFSMAKAMTPDEVSFSLRIQNRDSFYHFDLPETTGLKWLRNIRLFSEVNPYLRGTVDDREIITKAANGIYDSFLGVAEIAILNGKEEMARSYLLRAQNYRKEHAGYVTSDSLFNKVFGELVAGSLSPCDTLFAASKYPDALQCYLDFENGFDSLTLSLIHRGLEPKIQFCRYKMLIGEGEKNLSKNDKPEAGRCFFLARQLAQEKSIPADTLLDSLCREAYPYYLVHLLNIGEVWVWMGQLGRARQFADSIAYLQRTTGVGSSRDLSDALAGYKRKLDKRICWNANETVDVLLLRAKEKRKTKAFIGSASIIDSVEAIIRQNPDCLIPQTGLIDTVTKYLRAVDFQRMLQRIELEVLNGDYDKVISGLMEINHFYRSENITRFGLDSIAMFDFIREKSIQALTVSAFLNFQDKNDLDGAFTYLKLLRLQEYPRNYAKSFLKWTGKEFAGRDFRDQREKDPVLLVRSYTGFDPWMKRFRFAYYSQTQHLRHKPGIIYLFRKFFP